VRLTRTSANDASVVRKIYLSIDPMRYRTIPTKPQRTPEFGLSDQSLTGIPKAGQPPLPEAYFLTTIPLIRQQNG